MTLDTFTSKSDLIDYFARAAKPAFQWRIACAHEKFAYRLDSLKPVGYGEAKGLKEWLSGMAGFGWMPDLNDKGDVTSLRRGHASIRLGIGGQVRLIGAPLQTLHETSAEIDQHLVEACEIAEAMGTGFLGMGFHPTAKPSDLDVVPTQRGEALFRYLSSQGTSGSDVLLRSAGTQVALNYADETDMVEKFRIAVALQPIASAIFSSSPFRDGDRSGFLSTRLDALAHMDRARFGQSALVFDDGFGFEMYTDYALDIPMIAVERGGVIIDCSGQSFRDFLEGKLPALPGSYPTAKDWGDHLANLFPNVRLRKTIEMRGADSGSSEMLLALPSFWTGLLYDGTASRNAADVFGDWSKEAMAGLDAAVPQLGFQAEINGEKVFDVAERVIGLAQQGLRRRVHRLYDGADETRHLDILLSLAESQQSRADQLLMQKEHFADFSLEQIFETCRLLPPPDLREVDNPGR